MSHNINETSPATIAPVFNSALAADVMQPRFDQVKLINAQQNAARLHAHADHLTAHQRASGVRIRLCTTGCYAVYNAEGNFIARTSPPGTLTGLPAAALKTAAARMAFSEELTTVCRAADMDYESSGTVSPATIAAIRKLLGALADA